MLPFRICRTVVIADLLPHGMQSQPASGQATEHHGKPPPDRRRQLCPGRDRRRKRRPHGVVSAIGPGPVTPPAPAAAAQSSICALQTSQRWWMEGHFGELMDVLAPTLSSTQRTKSRYRDNPLPTLPTGIDAAARHEAILLLHLLAYELMHAGRRAMELATHTGWSLRRFRERVLRVGGRVLLHARRVTLVVAQTAAGFWSALWPRFERFTWAGS